MLFSDRISWGLQTALPVVDQFRFRIQTRDGLVIDDLRVQAYDPAEAERKLRPSHRGCVILEAVPAVSGDAAVPLLAGDDGACVQNPADDARDEGPCFERVADLICRIR